jgi:two-component system chemotaxis response regulator CheY
MSSTCSKCVLVVDDDDAIREMIGEVLQTVGYRVETAANGLQALAKVGTTRPDAILLDLMMPVMDGWTFLQECRANPLCGGRPVAVMSAHRDAQNASALGVNSILSKPFDVDVLLDTVKRLLQ